MKRRHFSPASPTVAASAASKKGTLFTCSEERKLDTAVLLYQNQKLGQQLEVQKVEHSVLENKFKQLKDEQVAYDDALTAVKKSWTGLVDNMRSLSSTRNLNKGHDNKYFNASDEGGAFGVKDELLRRLLDAGATESTSGNISGSQMEVPVHEVPATNKILENVVSAIDRLWSVSNRLTNSFLGHLPEDEAVQQLYKAVTDSHMEVKDLRSTVGDLHLKHRSVTKEVWAHRDTQAKYKSQTRRLAEELESATAELKESERDLIALKSQRDNGHGAPFLLPALGSSFASGDGGSRDRQKEAQELESACKEMLDLATSRLLELQNLHGKRKEMFSKISEFRNMMDVKHDLFPGGFTLLHEQLEKSKSEVDNQRAFLEKLQIERDNIIWLEKEVIMKLDLADVSRRASLVAESRSKELEKLIVKLVDERVQLETKLEEACQETGRKVIISEFKDMVSSLPKDMEIMQNQLAKHKKDASEIHSLRAEVRSVANILDRKENERNILSRKFGDQISEIRRLQATVQDLKNTSQELKVFLDVCKRESSDSRDVLESRELEYKAWADVQRLKSSLDEHSLEQRVKAANEAEAIAQQRLAATEAEIAELRQKLESSGRELVELSEVLKSKCEEGEAYLSEIESIGQAYEDLQTQNQNLLQQITERDDYNIKLFLDSVSERQLQDGLRMEIQCMHKDTEQANMSLDFYGIKVVRLEDQIRNLAEQVGKLVDDGWQNSVCLDNIRKRLLDVQRESEQLRKSLDETWSSNKMSRKEISALQVQLEEERFNYNRIDEDIEVKLRKAAGLKARTQGSFLEKLQQELREYKGILKCGICDDRQKEVVIAKCYHLLCNPCVQRTLENRHRKCPVCLMSFGPNDIKPIYI